MRDNYYICLYTKASLPIPPSKVQFKPNSNDRVLIAVYRDTETVTSYHFTRLTTYN